MGLTVKRDSTQILDCYCDSVKRFIVYREFCLSHLTATSINRSISFVLNLYSTKSSVKNFYYNIKKIINCSRY